MIEAVILVLFKVNSLLRTRNRRAPKTPATSVRAIVVHEDQDCKTPRLAKAKLAGKKPENALRCSLSEYADKTFYSYCDDHKMKIGNTFS